MVLTPAPEFRIRMEWREEESRGGGWAVRPCPSGCWSGCRSVHGTCAADTYGILAAFGRDCAGAGMLLPDGEQPGAEGRGGYTPITSTDLTTRTVPRSAWHRFAM